VKAEVGLVEEVAEMSVAGQEQIRRDHDADLHVDGEYLAGAGQVVDQYQQLHPALPLVRLISTQD